MKLRIPERLLFHEEVFTKGTATAGDPSGFTLLLEQVYSPPQLICDWAAEHFVNIVSENPKEIRNVWGSDGPIETFENYYAEGKEENVVLMRLRFGF